MAKQTRPIRRLKQWKLNVAKASFKLTSDPRINVVTVEPWEDGLKEDLMNRLDAGGRTSKMRNVKNALFAAMFLALLIQSAGYVQAQTPGHVPIFDQPGTGACNSGGGNDCVDSVITQDSTGNIGIGTTTPAAKLDVVGTAKANALTLPSTADASTGVLNLGGSPFLHAFGPNNTFLGTNAGNFMVGTCCITAIGFSALTNISGGFGFNTATGTGAMFNTTTGSFNTATGGSALLNNTTGSQNTATGTGALQNTTGDNNTAVGHLAGGNNTTGSLNTFIGFLAGPPMGTAQLSNATAIGANAQVSASNALVLGDGTVNVGIGVTAPVNKLDVAGDVRIGTGTNGCVMDRSGTVIAGTCSSDARLKQNVQPFDPVLEQLIRLEPVHFDWKTEEYPELHLGTSRSFGLIAQQVEKVLPELVTTDERGFEAVKYSQLPLLLLQAVRELKAENDSLRKQVETQKEEFQSELEAIKQLLQVDTDRSIHAR